MNISDSNIQTGGIYQHIDGLTYRVDEIFPDATGYEVSGKIGYSVKYTQLEEGESYPAGTVWIRKIEDFTGTVEVEGQIKNIFERVMENS